MNKVILIPVLQAVSLHMEGNPSAIGGFGEDQRQAVLNVMRLTGLSESEAVHLLDGAGGDADAAVLMHVENLQGLGDASSDSAMPTGTGVGVQYQPVAPFVNTPIDPAEVQSNPLSRVVRPFSEEPPIAHDRDVTRIDMGPLPQSRDLGLEFEGETLILRDVDQITTGQMHGGVDQQVGAVLAYVNKHPVDDLEKYRAIVEHVLKPGEQVILYFVEREHQVVATRPFDRQITCFEGIIQWIRRILGIAARAARKKIEQYASFSFKRELLRSFVTYITEWARQDIFQYAMLNVLELEQFRHRVVEAKQDFKPEFPDDKKLVSEVDAALVTGYPLMHDVALANSDARTSGSVALNDPVQGDGDDFDYVHNFWGNGRDDLDFASQSSNLYEQLDQLHIAHYANGEAISLSTVIALQEKAQHMYLVALETDQPEHVLVQIQSSIDLGEQLHGVAYEMPHNRKYACAIGGEIFIPGDDDVVHPGFVCCGDCLNLWLIETMDKLDALRAQAKSYERNVLDNRIMPRVSETSDGTPKGVTMAMELEHHGVKSSGLREFLAPYFEVILPRLDEIADSVVAHRLTASSNENEKYEVFKLLASANAQRFNCVDDLLQAVYTGLIDLSTMTQINIGVTEYSPRRSGRTPTFPDNIKEFTTFANVELKTQNTIEVEFSNVNSLTHVINSIIYKAANDSGKTVGGDELLPCFVFFVQRQYERHSMVVEQLKKNLEVILPWCTEKFHNGSRQEYDLLNLVGPCDLVLSGETGAAIAPHVPSAAPWFEIMSRGHGSFDIDEVYHLLEEAQFVESECKRMLPEGKNVNNWEDIKHYARETLLDCERLAEHARNEMVERDAMSDYLANRVNQVREGLHAAAAASADDVDVDAMLNSNADVPSEDELMAMSGDEFASMFPSPPTTRRVSGRMQDAVVADEVRFAGVSFLTSAVGDRRLDVANIVQIESKGLVYRPLSERNIVENGENGQNVFPSTIELFCQWARDHFSPAQSIIVKVVP